MYILFGRGENIFDSWFQDIRKAGITSIRSIGEPSKNGFIRELKRTENGYDSYVILKSNLTRDSDNLYYEWYVGSYLNTLMHRFPIFVKTYGIYEYTPESKAVMLNEPDNARSVLNGLKDTTFVRSLQEPELQCIVVQQVHQSISFTSLLEDYKATPTDVLKHEILCILYQIYFVLPLIPSFSHNDLHTDNVILTPAVDKCYQYVYSSIYGTFSFQCRYAAKLIDYGRCVYPGTKWVTEKLAPYPNANQFGYPFYQVGVTPCHMLDFRLLKICMDYGVIGLPFFQGMSTKPVSDEGCEVVTRYYLSNYFYKNFKNGFPDISKVTGKLEKLITPMYSLPIACTIYISETDDMRVVWPPVGGKTKQRQTRQTRQTKQTKQRRKSYRRRVPPLR